MNIILSGRIAYNRLRADTLIVPMFKGEKESSYALPAAVRKIVASIIASKEFQGGALETQVLYTGTKGVARVCLLGLGEKKECSLEVLTRAYGTAGMRMKKLKAKSVAVIVREDFVKGKTVADSVHAAALGLRIANYHTTQYKSKKKEITSIVRATLILPARPDRAVREALRRATAIADGLDFVRYLGNSPANIAIPAYLADAARDLAKNIPGLTVTIFDKKRIEKEKMGGLLGVAQGSQHDPRFIICEYGAAIRKGAPCHCKGHPCRPIVLVGKAITFDSGGISLKPWKGMDEMKFDMAGGAAVMAIVAIAAKLKLPVHVVGLVPAAENMPSHTAYKPGDVLTFADGTTVEILTTDAEGRLVVADGLLYAKRYKPQAIIDVATLTGAVLVSLADFASGLFTDHDDLAAILERLGKETGDRVWRLPLVKEWNDSMKSSIADLKQVPTVRIADATLGGLFLQHFVDKNVPWAHLDVAGTAWKAEGYPYAEPGATGAPVRLLVRWLEEMSGGKK